MIESMTGFGRSEVLDGERKYTVEMKGVNHRYLDVNVRLPRQLNFLEPAVRNLVKQRILRGKVDIAIDFEDQSQAQTSLQYNEDLAREYLQYLKQMSQEFSLEDDIRTSTLSRYPEVFTMAEPSLDEEVIWNGLQKALNEAIDQFIEARASEGENLRQDLVEKLSHLETVVAQIEQRAPQIVTEYREKIEAKMQELLADTQIDESRIASEAALYADKICTDEELVRLKSHIMHMKETLNSEEAGVGRKLDFITQEMNREANTILSKANDLETSDAGIELKTEIEKIREQIQNIE